MAAVICFGESVSLIDFIKVTPVVQFLSFVYVYPGWQLLIAHSSCAFMVEVIFKFKITLMTTRIYSNRSADRSPSAK